MNDETRHITVVQNSYLSVMRDMGVTPKENGRKSFIRLHVRNASDCNKTWFSLKLNFFNKLPLKYALHNHRCQAQFRFCSTMRFMQSVDCCCFCCTVCNCSEPQKPMLIDDVTSIVCKSLYFYPKHFPFRLHVATSTTTISALSTETKNASTNNELV